MQYTLEQKKNIKIEENKINYDIRRKKSFFPLSNRKNENTKQKYINGLLKLAKLDFDYFITLTFDPKKIGRKNLLKELEQNELKQLAVEFPELEPLLVASNFKRLSLEFVEFAGTAYFNCLFRSMDITNAFSLIERDKSGRWHIHALISSNREKFIASCLKTKWLYGYCKVDKIGYNKVTKKQTQDLVTDRENIINYITKTFNPASKSHTQQKRLDYWHLFNFEKNVETKALQTGAAVYTKSISEKPVLTDLIEFAIDDPTSFASLYQLSPRALFYFLTVIFMFMA